MNVAELALAADQSVDATSTGKSDLSLARVEFQRFVKPHLDSLYRLCLALADSREAAEDLLQNALLKAYVHRESFAGRGSALGWLSGIVKNEWMETVRTIARRRALVRQAVESAQFSGEEWSESPVGLDPESGASGDEEIEGMLRSLRALPEDYRMALVLCDLEGMSHSQAALALGVPIGTIKSRQSRGRAQLRATLESR